MRRSIIALQGQLSCNTWEPVQGNAEAADVFLQREVSRPEEASFVAEVSRAFEQRQMQALSKLREPMRQRRKCRLARPVRSSTKHGSM